MKIEPLGHDVDPFKHLTPFENKTRVAAVVFAFCGVFVWALKILLA